MGHFVNCHIQGREVLDLLHRDGSIKLIVQTLLVTDDKHLRTIVKVTEDPS